MAAIISMDSTVAIIMRFGVLWFLKYWRLCWCGQLNFASVGARALSLHFSLGWPRFLNIPAEGDFSPEIVAAAQAFDVEFSSCFWVFAGLNLGSIAFFRQFLFWALQAYLIVAIRVSGFQDSRVRKVQKVCPQTLNPMGPET